jgi:hypothetical protein
VPTAPSPAFYAANCDPAFGSSDPTQPNFLQCTNLRGNAGRNIMYGPGLVNLDSSVFKNFPIHKISESFVAQFRVEIFNILNHPNYQSPNLVNSDIFNADTTANFKSATSNGTAGALTATTTFSRQVQFALKLSW